MASDVGDIVKNLTDDIKVLVRGEVELAKAELTSSAKAAGAGAGMFGAAGYLALNAVSLLFIAGALGLALLVGYPLGFVIMAVILLVIAAILALIGKSQVKKIKAPEETIAEAKATGDAVKLAVERGKAQAELPADRRLPVGTTAGTHGGASTAASGQTVAPGRTVASTGSQQHTGGSHRATGDDLPDSDRLR